MKTFSEFTPAQRSELRFAAACALAAVCAVIITFSTATFAQVTKPGSKEERETDAKPLTAVSSEKPATPADRALLEVQLQALIDAYERGDVGFFQAKIDPAMPGYSRLLDSMRRDATAQTRPRLLFTDQTWSIGPNVAMLQARFQKRYFDSRTLNPELIEGRVVMLLARDGELWRINAITGDNPFESAVVAPCSTGVVRLLSPPNSNAEPFFIEIDDADLAGVSSIQADLITSRGDRELLTLAAFSPDGKFRVRINAQRLTERGAAVPNDGVVQLNGDVTITARYADQCVAGTRAQQIIAASDTRRDPGVLGQLACRIGGNTSFVSLANASTNAASSLPISIELADPDLAGLPSIDVLVRTAGGDVETLTLGAISSLGRFSATSMPARAATALAAAQRNGTLDFSGPSAISVEYVDQRPGAVGRTQTVSADCGGLPSGYQNAQLSCAVTTTLLELANFTAQPRNVPAQISIFDPDLALTNPAFVNVVLRNSLGDSETVRLDAQGTGRYSANSVAMTSGAPTQSNGNLGFADVGSITMEYVDATTASGAPQTITQSCGGVSRGFSLATLSCSANATQADLANAIRVPRNTPAQIILNDPDLAISNPAFVNATVRNSLGDSETLRLDALGSGRYGANAIPMTSNAPTPGNGSLDFNQAGAISIEYLDVTTPSGGPQSVTQACGNVTPSFTLATLTASFPGVNANTVSPFAGRGGPFTLPCSVVLRDPDLMVGSVSVNLAAAGISPTVDQETLTLNRTSPGVYELTSCRYDGYSNIAPPFSDLILFGPSRNNGIINLGGRATTITLTYTDSTAPGGGSQTVSTSAVVNN